MEITWVACGGTVRGTNGDACGLMTDTLLGQSMITGSTVEGVNLCSTSECDQFNRSLNGGLVISL